MTAVTTGTAVVAGRPRGRMPATSRTMRRTRRHRALVAWGFALPFALVFAIFMLLPIVGSFAMSFTDFTAKDVRTPFAVDFTGLGQYVEIFNDPRFLKSLGVTGLFVLGGIPLTMVAALLLALALNTGSGRFVAVLRVGFYAPVVTGIVAVAVVWRYILQPDGLLNNALAVIGISGPNWLSDPAWALPSLILLALWRNVGTLMVIFLAGLQAIPDDVKEAARVDGATGLRMLWSITIPLLRPTLLLGAVMISVGYLQFFDEAFVMTQGRPLDSTLSTAYYTFQQFGFGKYGTASAASYVLFLTIALLSLLQFRLLRSKD